MYGRIEAPNLLLYKGLHENHPSLTISLYEIKVNYNNDFQSIIELQHKYDFKALYLTTVDPDSE